MRSITLAILITLGSYAVPATAQTNITYTWHEDDGFRQGNGTPVSGSLVVSETAQKNGQITLGDVVFFGFQSPYRYFHDPFIESAPFPIPISTANAGFTGLSNVLQSYTFINSLVLSVDDHYNVVGGESWTTSPDGISGYITGVGHWTLQGASSVPEPGTVALLVAGGLAGAGLFMRRRRKQRQTQTLG